MGHRGRPVGRPLRSLEGPGQERSLLVLGGREALGPPGRGPFRALLRPSLRQPAYEGAYAFAARMQPIMQGASTLSHNAILHWLSQRALSRRIEYDLEGSPSLGPTRLSGRVPMSPRT